MFGYFNIVDAQGVVVTSSPLVFEEALSKIADMKGCALVAVDSPIDEHLAKLERIWQLLGWRFGSTPQDVAAQGHRIPTELEKELNALKRAREHFNQRERKRTRRAITREEAKFAA